MRADRVLGKMEMFVNDWLVQLGQGINPQVCVCIPSYNLHIIIYCLKGQF